MKSKTMGKQKGFATIEVVAAIVVIMLMALGIGPKVSAAFEKTNEKTIVDDINLIVIAALDKKSPNPTYAGVSISTLTADDYIKLPWGNGVGANPKNGNYTAGPNSSDARLLDVTVTGLQDAAQCTRLEDKLEASTNDANSASCSGTTLTLTF